MHTISVESTPKRQPIMTELKDDAALFELEDGQIPETRLNARCGSVDSAVAKLDKRITLKLDLFITPLVTIVYLLSFLDRINIGNARVAGMQKDLKLTDLQYQTAITITFVPYIAAEIPANLILKKVGARIFIPVVCFLWGLVSTLQCLVQGYGGLVACRFFLGLMEGGLFPGLIFYLSTFYRRQQLALRIAMFFTAASLGGAFSGLLAAAISNMDGVGDMSGWRWIFCLEGIFTCVWGILIFFLLPDGPQSMKWLDHAETDRCMECLTQDHALAPQEKITPRKVLSVFEASPVYLVILGSFTNGILVFSLAFFAPTIIRAMGYSPIRTQLMSVPPYAAGVVLTILASFFSDKTNQRAVVFVIAQLLALVGIIMFYVGRSVNVRYAGVFCLLSGVFSSVPANTSWAPNNIAGSTRRATIIAVATIGNTSGAIVSTWIFPSTDGPYYLIAAKVMLAANVVGIASAVGARIWYNVLNKRKQTPEYRERVQGKVAHLPLGEQVEQVGDAHPDYKYTL